MNQSFTPVRVRTLHPTKPSGHGPDDPQPRASSTARRENCAAEYYAQRASVGLIVTEGTQPSG